MQALTLDQIALVGGGVANTPPPPPTCGQFTYADGTKTLQCTCPSGGTPVVKTNSDGTKTVSCN